jgi:hypothetical protein
VSSSLLLPLLFFSAASPEQLKNTRVHAAIEGGRCEKSQLADLHSVHCVCVCVCCRCVCTKKKKFAERETKKWRKKRGEKFFTAVALLFFGS